MSPQDSSTYTTAAVKNNFLSHVEYVECNLPLS